MKVSLVLIAGIIASAYSGSIRFPRQVSSTVELDAALAAAGSGWAAENHADNVQVIGAGGWGPNAELSISSAGESVVDQVGAIFQITVQDEDTSASLNNVGVAQTAEALEGQVLEASGLEISNAQSGAAVASGEGASAAEAVSSLSATGSAGWGMAKP